MAKWMLISAVVAALAVPAVWASCGNCGGDKKEAKAGEKTASGEKAKSGCSKSEKTVADAGGCPKACAEKAFSKLDANADGKIDREEFIGGMPAMMQAYEAGKQSGDTAVLTSATEKSEGKPGCAASCSKANKASQDGACPKKAASNVLTAFDLDKDGKLSTPEIERANKVMTAIMTVSKAEHARLVSDAGGCCEKAKSLSTSIETLASRSFDSLQPVESAAPAGEKPAAPAAGADASAPKSPAQGG